MHGKTIRVLAGILLGALATQDAEARDHDPPPPSAAFDAEQAHETVARFTKKNRGRRAEMKIDALLRAVTSDVPELGEQGTSEDPYLTSMQRITGEIKAGGKSRPEFKKRPGKKKAASDAPSPHAVFGDEIIYRFGDRTVISRNKTTERALRKGTPVSADLLSPSAALRSLLLGCSPEVVIELAAIQRALDVHGATDRFARFLESWRHFGPSGEESFYAALDRTTGTHEELFFYDQMLDDFVRYFAKEEAKRWREEERHARLIDAFLSYRQYRGFVEAIAYSLVLPPDVPLPERLARYDYVSVTAGYSLRHQIDIRLEHQGGDVAALVEDVARFLAKNPIPDELWQPYQPVVAFNAQFQARLQTIIRETGSSTDALGERRRESRQRLGDAIRTSCLAHLDI